MMTTDSLLMLCHHHTDCWLSNGTHSVHFHQSRYELWDDSGAFLDATCLEQIQQMASDHAIDLLKGWFLVAHV